MYRYAVVIEGQEGSYSAYVPDLPGCVAAGPTLEEVRRLMREAIELHLRGLAEDGLPIPEPTMIDTYFETVQVGAS
jgi:predicted RNase H-like HicB family nuclease